MVSENSLLEIHIVFSTSVAKAIVEVLGETTKKKDCSIAVAFLLSFKSQIATLDVNEWGIENCHNS